MHRNITNLNTLMAFSTNQNYSLVLQLTIMCCTFRKQLLRLKCNIKNWWCVYTENWTQNDML